MGKQCQVTVRQYRDERVCHSCCDETSDRLEPERVCFASRFESVGHQGRGSVEAGAGHMEPLSGSRESQRNVPCSLPPDSVRNPWDSDTPTLFRMGLPTPI